MTKIRLLIAATRADEFHVTPQQFEAALAKWRNTATVHYRDTHRTTVTVNQPDNTTFDIDLAEDGRTISTNATNQHAAEVATWAANTFPAPSTGELWLTNDYNTGHSELTPGMP